MKYYGVQDIDKHLIQKYFDYQNGFFIEVGGNDGIFQSNTAHLEFYKNWKGILIEAIPIKFDQMIKNRPNSICINTCLSDEDDTTIEFNDVNLMSFVSGARKTLENELQWIKEGENCQNIKLNQYSLKTNKLETILKRNEIFSIDFFSLDVEGYELQVLRGLNMNIYRPKYILIECTHKEEIFDFMNEMNYEMIDKFVVHDYLFLDKTINNNK